MVDIHPPKQETFDVRGKTNTDPKGAVRPVDQYRLVDRALYMARPADHPRFGYLESWLIPHLDIRVSIFHFRPGAPGSLAGQQLYVDIAEVTVEPDAADQQIWHTTDLYIDVVTYRGNRWEILDLEELGGALTRGYIDTATADRALTSAQRLVTGMLDAGGVAPWLAREGVQLTWASNVPLAPPE
ncbi:MAG TPA: DUF402 domain-containing protein [Candidatus Corynebacterium avicola]|uniref:DUF402 domain-containing protein n=1 Tax=Candidatus Corynebacterium avicola TaxID=2838527 RepID=A0A9D1RNP5_9CORY|nr:DUF402 domain-containing protein [Candidatus Corynebacterium avicola]